MKTLLMATDLSARSDRALERAVRLASERSCNLVVVHVVDEDLPPSLADAQQDGARQIIQKHVDTLTANGSLDISIDVVVDRPWKAVLEIAEKTAADLIVLGMHREDSFKDMFRGTTAERIIRAGSVPVLLVKERATAPYQRIMVGVDFSVFSKRAIEFAAKLEPDGALHLVHAYNVPFKGFLNDSSTRDEIKKQRQAEFEQMVEEEMTTFLSSFSERAPRLERIMQQGTPREVITRQMNRLNPDLLVVGTHGRTGVALGFLGSVAEDLLRNPPCDVLAVKAW